MEAYVGYPDIITDDQVPKFTIDDFCALCLANNVKIQPSGIESHYVTGIGKRCHVYLRQVFSRDHDSFIDAERHHILYLATKVVNDSAGPDGPVLKLVVFVIVPRLVTNLRELPNQQVCFKIMHKTYGEMIKLTSLKWIQKTIQCNVPIAVDANMHMAYDVLVYRERTKRFEEPVVVIDVRGKYVISNVDKKCKQLFIDKDPPYRRNKQDDNSCDTDKDQRGDGVLREFQLQNEDVRRSMDILYVWNDEPRRRSLASDN